MGKDTQEQGACSGTHVERLDVADEVGQLFDDLRQASCTTNVRVSEASRKREREREVLKSKAHTQGQLALTFPSTKKPLLEQRKEWWRNWRAQYHTNLNTPGLSS